MTEGGAPLSFRRILAHPNDPPPPTTIPKCFTILMTEMRGAIIFVEFWCPQCLPLPDATILNHLNDSESGAPLSVVGSPRRHNTNLILLTERGGHYLV